MKNNHERHLPAEFSRPSVTPDGPVSEAEEELHGVEPIELTIRVAQTTTDGCKIEERVGTREGRLSKVRAGAGQKDTKIVTMANLPADIRFGNACLRLLPP